MTKNIYWKFAATLTFGVFSLPAQAGATATPTQTAKQFCNFYKQGNLDQQYRQIVSASFLKAIADAKRKDQAVSARNPLDKPPLGDGLPFQSVPDKGNCTVGTTRKINGRMQTSIFYDIGDGTPIRDLLMMIQENTQWKIDDVLFGPRYTDSTRRKLNQIFSLYKF